LTALLFARPALVAAPPVWDTVSPQYTVTPTSVSASSGGRSTSDHYLLTKRAYQNFVLSFTATRLPFEGPRPRAIIVWGVDPANHANRSSCFIVGHLPETDHPYRFRAVVARGKFALYRDGELVTRGVSVYGKPPARGRIGFLHYYNYDFRYEAIDLLSLETSDLPAPSGLQAEALPSGCARLRWAVPTEIAELLSYQVSRTTVGDRGGDRPAIVGVPAQTTFIDRTCQVGATYVYSVAATVDGSAMGPPSRSAPITVARGEPPKPVRAVRAVRRIDGSVRITWELPQDGRCAGVSILAGETPVTLEQRSSAKLLADSLPLTRTTFLVPAGSPRSLALCVEDPDGRTSALTAVEPRPSAPQVEAGRSWPQRHPMLLYSWEQVAAARHKIAEHDWARNLRDRLCGRADGVIKSPPRVPREPSDSHPLTGKVRLVGEAFLLTGDDRYARWVRDAMVAYADIYPNLKVHGSGRARMVKTGSGLYEAVRYVPLLLAYDMTHDSPVYSQDDHAQIERGFLRPAVDLFRVPDYSDPSDYRARDLHYKCYNFQAWFISAVGMTGLLLRDPDLVDYAIDGPYGLKHLLAHDIHDDGVFWERSLGYHHFVIHALYPFLEGAWHCNLDLWNLSVADDYNEDREPLANYCVGDGDHGPKSIKLMFDAPFYAVYGDLTYAQIADSGRGPLRADERFRTAWVRYRDSKYSWLFNRGRPGRKEENLHRSDADASAEIWIAYDEGHLYLAGQITDDVVTNTHGEPGAVWAGDALWFGLKWRDEPGGPYDFIYGLSPGNFRNTPPVPALFNRFAKNVGARSACKYAVVRVADGYIIEAAFPLTEFVPKPDEEGTPLRPEDGMRVVVDFVIYDCDDATRDSTKEKMVSWSCVTDRYDSAQGGTLLFGAELGSAGKALNAPRTARPLKIDGDLADWQNLGAGPVRIAHGGAVMTDQSARGLDLHALFFPQPEPGEGAFDLRGTRFCNNGVLQAGCSLFPSTGFAILREHLDENGRPPRDATCVTLNCGPHGGGHGHSDKLSIVLYADGQHWFPDFGSCGYSSTEKGTWTAQTISHNTTTVDGVSQQPTGDRNVTWPCDSSTRQTRSLIDFFKCNGLLKATAAHNDAVYDGVRLRRTVALVRDVLFDFFEVEGREEHQYDYALHIDGTLSQCAADLAPQDGPLGDKAGYQHITEVARAPLRGPTDMLWHKNDLRLQLSISGQPKDELIVGQSITTKLDRLMPMLVVRRSASRTVFATVAKPLADASQVSIEWLSTGNARTRAAQVQQNGETVLVVYNPTGAPVTVAGLTVNTRLATRVTTAAGGTLTAAAP